MTSTLPKSKVLSSGIVSGILFQADRPLLALHFSLGRPVVFVLAMGGKWDFFIKALVASTDIVDVAKVEVTLLVDVGFGLVETREALTVSNFCWLFRSLDRISSRSFDSLKFVCFPFLNVLVLVAMLCCLPAML